jgi:2-keto-4-pentenoate hydratase/2-oxohepta-3-ene-1,7-dioic acid hydratase in catechol pathway
VISSIPCFALGTYATAEGEIFPGLVIADQVHRIQDLLGDPRGRHGPLTMIDVLEAWEANWPILAAAAESISRVPSQWALPLSALRTLAPVNARQIICGGANYRKHVVDILVDHQAGNSADLSPEERRRRAETIMDHRAAHGQPFAFIKPFSCLLPPFGNLVVPTDSHELDWELELGAVIGLPARRVDRSKALDYVAGYVIANDISARDHISRPDFPSIGLDWVAGKSGPGFLPLGPVIVPAAFIPDPQDLLITLKLNGSVMQHESTADMIFSVARLIEFVSTHMQLLPGDVICTGSPSGNGAHYKRFLRPGDVLEGTITGLGTQRNTCVAEKIAQGAVLHKPFQAIGAF